MVTRAIGSFEGLPINLTIERRSKRRSNEQNAFYWACWIPLIQTAIYNEWGELYNPNEVHTMLKTTCNYEEHVNPATGEVVRVPKSSTKLTTYEWEKEFKQQIRQLCMDFFGLDLPEPISDEE
nr:MAG TPA: protein NinB [Caudoviricetes sp.]